MLKLCDILRAVLNAEYHVWSFIEYVVRCIRLLDTSFVDMVYYYAVFVDMVYDLSVDR